MTKARMHLGALIFIVFVGGCGTTSPDALVWDDGAAVTYAPTGDNWETRSLARLEVTDDGCLVLVGMSADRPTVIAGVPAGTTVSERTLFVFPDQTQVRLGDMLTFSQEPFSGTGAELPATTPRTSPLPAGCDAGLDVVLVIPAR